MIAELAAEPPPAASGWLPTLLSMLGLLGGLGGITAMVSLISQRKKFRAEAVQIEASAANSITDTALALLQPLREQVAEATAEARRSRREAEESGRQLKVIRGHAEEIIDLLLSWKARILAPDATVEGLRLMVRSAPDIRRDHINGVRVGDGGNE